MLNIVGANITILIIFVFIFIFYSIFLERFFPEKEEIKFRIIFISIIEMLFILIQIIYFVIVGSPMVTW